MILRQSSVAQPSFPSELNLPYSTCVITRTTFDFHDYKTTNWAEDTVAFNKMVFHLPLVREVKKIFYIKKLCKKSSHSSWILPEHRLADAFRLIVCLDRSTIVATASLSPDHQRHLAAKFTHVSLPRPTIWKVIGCQASGNQNWVRW